MAKRRRSVCRSWRAATQDPRFVRRHLQLSRAGPPSVLDVPCEPRLEDYWSQARSKELEFRRVSPGGGDPTPPPVRAELMLAVEWSAGGVTALGDPVHCDGIVLVPTAPGELFLSNKATREFAALPPGSPSVVVNVSVAFGFDPWTGTYKVARCFYRRFDFVDDAGGCGGYDYDVGHEVLTLGVGTWEPTEDPPYAVVPRRPICTPGAFYYTALVASADDPRRPSELLCFRTRDETFDVVPNPPCFSGGVIGDRDELTELGSRLCCAHARAPAAVDIWLSTDHHDDDDLEWSVAYRVELLRPVKEFVLPLAVSADGDEVLLSVDRRVLYKFNAKKRALEIVVDMQRVPDLYGPPKPELPLRFLHHAVPYVESLVSIHRRNY
ncbi:hypothetical protein EJB05_37160, partial [Eragrostis curvula]